MFKILGLMILGIIIGYGLRRISFLRKVKFLYLIRYFCCCLFWELLLVLTD